MKETFHSLGNGNLKYDICKKFLEKVENDIQSLEDNDIFEM